MFYIIKDVLMKKPHNNIQLYEVQPSDLDIFESEEAKKEITDLFRKALFPACRKQPNKQQQSRSKVHDRTLNGVLSTTLDRNDTIFNNKVSFSTNGTAKGGIRVLDELKDIPPQERVKLSKSHARRFLGVTYQIFQYYENEGYILRYKDEGKIIYYKYHLKEFINSGKRLSAHDEEVLNKKLQAEKNGTNQKTLY